MGRSRDGLHAVEKDQKVFLMSWEMNIGVLI
jgi:hypothetical protein